MYNKEIFKRYLSLYGREFFKNSERPYKKTVRVNCLKITKKGLAERLEKQRFKVSESEIPEGLIIERERKRVGGTVEHLCGYFFVQDLTSMLSARWLSPKPDDKVLDMCAAPGGKTTHLSEIMKNQGFILAVDIDKSKNIAMINNLHRMGTLNVTYINADMTKPLEQEFDKILLDAPCSASGIIRKDKAIKQKLTLEYVRKYSEKQRLLIDSAYQMLKKGGLMVYSTCSVDSLENYENAEYASSIGFKKIDEMQYLPGEKYGMGFYLSKLKK